MKKKIIVTGLVLSLAVSAASTMAFAETADAKIQTIEQLKSTITAKMEDGTISAAERQEIVQSTSESVVEELVIEKLDKAVDILEDRDDMTALPMGQSIANYEYDLGDGCKLIVELRDRTEFEGGNIGIMPMATSGSQTLWKDYGNRYFTAKATVDYSIGSATFSLENHYTLSANGIDERSGVAKVSGSDGISVSKGTPQITDGSARTPGASDASIECTFSCKNGKSAVQKYKMTTTVKYLAHDKTGKRIQIGQTWKLTKTS